MIGIEVDNGYLIVAVNENESNDAAVEAISRVEYGEGRSITSITFDTEEDADALMDQLAEVLCENWLDDDPGELLS